MSSSSDSDDDNDVGGADLDALIRLETALKKDPRVYDTHVQYITVLRKCKLWERLRKAREAMSDRFPLSETLWREWLTDELQNVQSEDDFERISEMYEQAVEDYHSPTLWVDYLRFMEASSTDTDRMREVYEQALEAAGMDVAGGAAVWEAARAYETKQLEAAPADARAALTEALRRLYTRQLALPHATHAATWAEYEAWEATPAKADQTKKSYAAAVKLFEARAPHEHAVASPAAAEAAAAAAPDATRLAAYLNYIRFEEAADEPMRVQCLYERAIALFPVTHELWMRYVRFLDRKLKDADRTRAAFERGVRNCPWVGALWADYVRFEERAGATADKLAEVVEAALAGGMRTFEETLQVLLAQADALRRAAAQALAAGDTSKMVALRNVFQKATSTLAELFPKHVDKSLRLPAYWADCEVTLGQDIAKAREVWEALLKNKSYASLPEVWHAYVRTERTAGQVAGARAVYKRCYNRSFEGDTADANMCTAWLQFEREAGDAADYASVAEKVESRLAELAVKTAEQASKLAAAAAAQAAKEKRDAAPVLTPTEIKRKRQEADPNFKPEEAKAAKKQKVKKEKKEKKAPTADEEEQKADQSGKVGKGASSSSTPAANEKEAAAELTPAAAPSGDADTPMTEAAADGGVTHGSSTTTNAATAGDAGTKRFSDQLTVFVSSLSFDVNEEDLREVFAPCGSLKEVRLLRQKDTGRSRGNAYVEFADEAGLNAAVALSGTDLRGRRLNVARSKPTAPRRTDLGGGGRGRAGGRFDAGRGRGGRGRGGRGLGYTGDAAAAGGGGGGGDASGQGAPRSTQKAALGFVPRAVKSSSGAAAADTTPKSNADFRAMLFGKKPQETKKA